MTVKTVMLAEDSSDDAYFIKRACESAGIPHALVHVPDGAAAIEYLSGTGGYADRAAHPLPDLIFLDIKMPRRDGHEVLQWLRAQPAIQHLPVIMLTNSHHPADINRAYRLGVNSYLLKDADPEKFVAAVRLILKYWLVLNVGSHPS